MGTQKPTKGGFETAEKILLVERRSTRVCSTSDFRTQLERELSDRRSGGSEVILIVFGEGEIITSLGFSKGREIKPREKIVEWNRRKTIYAACWYKLTKHADDHQSQEHVACSQ